ncbi:hypothetical protein [Tunturiibacter gelidoferens]|uniref:Phasin family protein n=2 Tax=Tunturiibacter gelidiferens TaxID=3069689 RepID=A0AAU7Z2Y4_9BACT|nr:hypothetical protein [Edaphobacter lichenicola]MBB5340893.1 cytochrome c553 [Edaphobacter lichenicola]
MKKSKPVAGVTPKAVTVASATTLSDDQMQALAQSFHDIAVEIGQVRLNAISAGSKLTDSAIVQLQGYVYSLMTTAGNFALQAANLTLANADQAVSEISLATQAADKALDKLQDIDKAVKIASSVIVLAMAISTKDMGQIAAAAKSVVTAAGVSV